MPKNSSITTGLPLYLPSTAIQNLWNVSRSHAQTKTRVGSDPAANSKLQQPHNFTQLTTRNEVRGYNPFSKSDCKSENSNENGEQTRKFPDHKRNFPEPNKSIIGKRYEYQPLLQCATSRLQYSLSWWSGRTVLSTAPRAHSSHTVTETPARTKLWPEWAAVDRQHQHHPRLNPGEKDIHDLVAQMMSAWSYRVEARLPHLAVDSR